MTPASRMVCRGFLCAHEGSAGGKKGRNAGNTGKILFT